MGEDDTPDGVVSSGKERRYMTERHTSVRVGPQFQARIPDFMPPTSVDDTANQTANLISAEDFILGNQAPLNATEPQGVKAEPSSTADDSSAKTEQTTASAHKLRSARRERSTGRDATARNEKGKNTQFS
eukprot:Selendium_serpulae@DN2828_c0_g1_i2.p1